MGWVVSSGVIISEHIGLSAQPCLKKSSGGDSGKSRQQKRPGLQKSRDSKERRVSQRSTETERLGSLLAVG